MTTHVRSSICAMHLLPCFFVCVSMYMSAAVMPSKKIAEQAVFLSEQKGPPCYILIYMFWEMMH